MQNTMFKKRPGTSGIRGQLYETKLLSLINFRAKYDDDIEQFCLASNVDQIGAFDDICFRAKVKSFHKPVNVFIQAKHKENDKFPLLNNQYDLATYFDSYLKIRRAFEQNKEDLLFEGNFDEAECLFVMYTTAKDHIKNNEIRTNFAAKLNDLISTGGYIGTYKQPVYENSDVEFLCESFLKNQIMTLARSIAKLLREDADIKMLMNDELVSCYHVILAEKVVDVSAIQPGGHRNASFRRDFFESNDRFLLIIKDVLYKEILKKRKYKKDELNNLLETFLSTPTDLTILEKLIGSVMIYKNGKFKLVGDNTSEALQLELDKVFIHQSTVNEAFDRAARKILETYIFKVPAAFGNKDITIGHDDTTKQCLTYLTTKIVELVNKSRPNSIVTIDESLGDELLQFSRCLAGTVGNVLVLDDNTKLLKFADNSNSLGDLSKYVYEDLQCNIHNFHNCRFDVKVNNFPKLTFESGEHDKNLVKDFLSKLLFFMNQSNQGKVGEILKNEIEDHPYGDTDVFRIRSDAIFLEYHDQIQKWWMEPTASYLTKENDIFEKASRNIINKPLLTVTNMMQTIKMLNFKYTFNEEAVNSLDLHALSPTTVIVTANIMFTVAKLKQYYKTKEMFVLDLDYILNLPANDFATLHKELQNKDKKHKLIFVCNDLLNTRSSSKRLENIAKAVTEVQTIIITQEQSYDVVVKYFANSKTVQDFRINLTDFSIESQKSVLESETVIFQGKNVKLNELVDKDTIKLIKGDIFYKIIQHETVKVGKPIGNYNSYNSFKHLYIDRRISRTRKTDDTFQSINNVVVQTLYDINEHVVLITAVPGMGKSTLLTHLSVKTQEVNPKVWIVRINLLEHSKELNKWRRGGVVIDSTRFFRLLCQAALCETIQKMNESIRIDQDANGVLSTKTCFGNESLVFEFKMFLHMYNKGELIFLFDGFDEIFPHYKSEALSLLKTVKNHPRKHKVWITSRSYNEIKAILEKEFGTTYDIEHFTSIEQDTYLNKFWTNNISIKNLNSKQMDKIHNFIDFLQDLASQLSKRDGNIEKAVDSRLHQMPYLKVFLSLLNYLKIEVIASGLKLLSYNENLTDDSIFTYINDFVAPPLHLHLIADYLHHEIKDTTTAQWTVGISTYNIYKYFVDAKLKKIRFQEKNKIDVDFPENMTAYMRERAEFIAKHKQLGAFAIFFPHVREVFNENEIKEIAEIIETLKVGAEKTGFIHSVVNKMPIFMHKLFAEYFAVEYIYDILRRDISDGKRLIILGLAAGCHLLSMLDNKQKMDPLPGDIVEKNKKLLTVILQTGILNLIFEGNVNASNVESIALEHLK